VSHPIDRIAAVCARLREHVGDRDVASCAASLDDDQLVAGLADLAAARKALSLIESSYSAEVEKRSDRALGYAGLAQRAGHRTATSLIQHVTGQTRADVQRATSAGRDLAAAASPSFSTTDAARSPWFESLAAALLAGALSREQYDAIRRGLGDPPESEYPDLEPGLLSAAWREASRQLIEEAQDRSVEDLRAGARLARDSMDPRGVQLRFDERFAKRSLRWWVDDHGQHRATLVLDDEAAAWVRTILSAALRPRRGPRFVDNHLQTTDAEPPADMRTHEQLQYDTLVAVLRTGASADPAQAFGDRQPGIRIVVTQGELDRRDPAGHAIGVAHCEETGQSIPGSVLEKYLCDAGAKVVTVDVQGRPLDVGRDQRLFTKRQRDAISIRDGGCLDCGAEPSRCELHHIDHWWEHRGRTDVADGVLLCSNCHLRLHNQRRRIRRDAEGYWLTAPLDREGRPSGPPRLLRSRSLLRFERTAW
jgi:hypothetical protein